MTAMLKVVETPQEMIEFGHFGGLYVRRFRFFRSQAMLGHTHNYDHASQVMTGKFRYRLEYPGGEVIVREIKAPGIIHVPAEVHHEMQCLSEEGEIWCTFPARDPTGEIEEFVKSLPAQQEKCPYWSC